MKYKLKAYSIWEQGPREKQEDSIFPKYGEIVDTDRLFILCDGMGGHSAGEVASATVCSAMSNYILTHNTEPDGDFTDDDFRAALNAAYDSLDEKDNGAAKKMGTTLTFLKLHNAGCTIAHIGDSRVYHIRPGKNVEDTEILFQTEDHSLVNDLVKIGELTREEAKQSKQKNVITRAMQPCMERRSKADIYHGHDIKPGDYFMLCSDGILEQMEDENLKFIFSAKGGDITNKIDILVKATAHNHDNHSAILIHIVDVDDIVPYTSTSNDAGLIMAQVSDETNKPNATQDRNIDDSIQNKDNYKKPQYRPNRFLKNIVCCIVWALVIFGAFYLYRTVKNRNKPTKSVDIESPAKPIQNKPSKQDQHLTAPAQSEIEQPQTTIEPSGRLEDNDANQATQSSPDSSNASNTVVAPAPIPLSKLNNGNNDVISSDEDKAKEVIRKKDTF